MAWSLWGYPRLWLSRALSCNAWAAMVLARINPGGISSESSAISKCETQQMSWGKDLWVIEHPSTQDPFSASFLQNTRDLSSFPPGQFTLPRGRGMIWEHTHRCPGRCSGCPTWPPAAWHCKPCGCLPAPWASQREALLAPVSAHRLIQVWFILALHKT